jgi:hypothetical protein
LQHSEFKSFAQENFVLLFDASGLIVMGIARVCTAFSHAPSKCSRIVISLAKLGSRRIISIYGPERGGSFMTALDTVTSLELERSVFDSDEARILSIAFEKAWTYVQFDPTLGFLEGWERQSELARCLMRLLKLGNDNPVALANSGIALLHKSRRSA